MTKKYAIIVAGGVGTRMNSVVPKQFLLLRNKPVLCYSIEAFYTYDPTISIIVVLPHNQIEYWETLCKTYNFTIPHTITPGGNERFYSVKNGLKHTQASGLIAVHDGVRPLISTQIIKDAFNTAAKHAACIPVIKSIDSLRILQQNKHSVIDRNTIVRIQTPQVFKAEVLHKAYETECKPHFTDDASVVESYGISVTLIDGSENNIKITNAVDLKLAKILLEE